MKRLKALQSSSRLAAQQEEEGEDDEEEVDEAAGASKLLCLLLCTCVLVAPSVAFRALGVSQAGPDGGPPEGLLLWLQTLSQAVGVPVFPGDPSGRPGAAESAPSASEEFLQSELKLTGKGGSRAADLCPLGGGNGHCWDAVEGEERAFLG